MNGIKIGLTLNKGSKYQKSLKRQFLGKLSLTLVFLILAGCVSLSNLFQKPPEEEEVVLPIVQQKKDTLLTETIALLDINKEQFPERFQDQQQRFETALQNYLNVTDNENEQVIILEDKERLFIIPVQGIYTKGVLTEAQMSGNQLEIQRPLSPALNGEILDFTQLSDSDNQNLTLAALFQDSLVVFTRVGVDSFQTSTFTFPREVVSIIHSRIQTGILGRTPQEYSPVIVALTTALTDPVGFTMNSLWALEQDTTTVTDRIGNPANWISVVGQGLFRNPTHNVRAFLSLRELSNAPHYVLLDNAGYLHLLTDSSDQVIWSSSQPVGKRLFILPDNYIGVTRDTSHTFNLFQYTGESLDYLGLSQNFPGSVSALSTVEFGDTEGIGLNLLSTSDTGVKQSQIQYLPLNYLEWDSAGKYLPPSFPNYLASFKVLEQHPLQTDSLAPGFRFSLGSDIFETLIPPPGSDKPSLVSLSSTRDYRVWTIRFQRNLRLPNGSLLTADQIIRGWLETFKSYGLDSTETWLWRDITGIEDFIAGETESPEGLQQINNSTIRFEFDSPRPHFPEHLSHPMFRVYTTLPEYNFPVGFGPYYLTNLTTENRQTEVTTNRNRYYYGNMPSIEQLTLRYQQSNITDSLSEGEHAGGIIYRKKDVSYFQQLPQFQVREFPTGTTYFLALNPDTSVTTQAIRAQILNALDREVTANIIDASICTPQTELFGLQSPQITESTDTIDTDALQSLSIAFQEGDLVAQQIAERLAARLTQIGIPHEVPQSVPSEEFAQFRTVGDYEILIDHFTPSFNVANYNALELLNHGYRLPYELPIDWEDILLQSTQDISPLIQQLSQSGIFSPVLTSKSFGILPGELRDVQLYKNNILDLSSSWFPRRR